MVKLAVLLRIPKGPLPQRCFCSFYLNLVAKLVRIHWLASSNLSPSYISASPSYNVGSGGSPLVSCARLPRPLELTVCRQNSRPSRCSVNETVDQVIDRIVDIWIVVPELESRTLGSWFSPTIGLSTANPGMF